MSIEDEIQHLQTILTYCDNIKNPINQIKLKEISRLKGGFITNQIRAKVWPKLLGINRYNLLDYKKLIKSHHDERQVRVDIDRSFWSLDCARAWSDRRLNRKRTDLSNIIIALLSHNPGYYYFQGLHDVVTVFLLVFNDNPMTFAVVEQVCQRYLVDYMRRDFSSLSKIMKLIMVLIKRADPELSEFLEQSETEPFFATSWLITWLSHDIRSLDQIGRIFDVLLSSPPEYCFYLCASLVLIHREEVLELECDFSTVHNKLSRLLKKNQTPFTNSTSNLQSFQCDIDFEALILRADQLMKDIPPQDLLKYSDHSITQVIQENKLLLFNQSISLEQYLNNHTSLLSLISDHDILHDTYLENISQYTSSLTSSASRPENLHLMVIFTGWITFLRSETVGLQRRTTFKISSSFVKEMLKRVWRGIISPVTTACGVDKKHSRTLVVIALLGGIMSIGSWFYQMSQIKSDKSPQKNQSSSPS